MSMQNSYRYVVMITGLGSFLFLSGFGIFGHKKYEAPITKDTLQPDKVLFDRAIHDIEKGNYETARLTLNTLINTYDSSEYLAKAKLAIADAWYREGGAHGFAQAEAEYKDFILFYPNMEEAAESQYKVCQIHYRQMDKSDRDNAQAQRAEDECRQVMVQFPNSKFTPQATQLLRNTQEVLADKEYKTGDFYYGKGSFPAAASRLSFLGQQYPNYSGSDEALWQLADAYKHMGDHFENQEGDALTKIVRDYPLSVHVAAAKLRLQGLNRPVPAADLNAYNRMKEDLAGRTKPGMIHRVIGPFEGSPEVNLASKTGAPAMTNIRPSLPVSIPASAAGGGGTGLSDVTASQVPDTQAIDQKQDARIGTPAAETPQTTSQLTAPAGSAPAGKAGGTGEQPGSVGSTGLPSDRATLNPPTPAPEVLPTNHPPTKDQIKAQKAAQVRVAKIQKKEAEQKAKQDAKNGGKKPATPATTPAAATSPTTPQPAPAQQ
jgi:outer membrane protein assembly factor BamD